jgi:hypothetical protein
LLYDTAVNNETRKEVKKGYNLYLITYILKCSYIKNIICQIFLQINLIFVGIKIDLHPKGGSKYKKISMQTRL